MGTKVQCTSYFPGYYPMRDLNEDTDSSWSRFYEDKTLHGHLYYGSSEYDKEMLKRTMLEHEAIFRKQVYELHRLYRIQKGLMDEFQMKGFCRYSVPAETSQSNSFSSQMPHEGTKRVWQIPHLAVGSSSYNVVPAVASTDDMRPPLNFLEENVVQSGRFGIENGAPLKDSDLQESRVKSFPGRMFDLQLPADVYIESDVKLTLGTSECSSRRKDSWISDPHKQNDLPAHNLVDLNGPSREICPKVAADSASTHFLGPKTPCEENRWHGLPMKPNPSFLNRHSDEGSCSNFLYVDKGEMRLERPFYNNKADFDFTRAESRSGTSLYSSGQKLPVLSEPIQLNPTKTHGIFSPNNADIWVRKKTAPQFEISGRNHLARLNNSGPAALGTPNSFPVLPNSDYICTTSSLFSALTKSINNTSQIPLAVEGLPCFSRPAAIDVHLDRSNLNSKGDSSYFGNSEGYGHQKSLNGLQCTDLNLNQELLDQIQDGLTSQQDIRIGPVEEKCHVSSGEISWFTRKPTYDESVENKYASRMEFGFSHGYPQLKSSSSVADPELGFPSTSQFEKRMQRSEADDSPSVKKILGFPIFDMIQQNSKGREKDDLSSIELSPEIKTASSEKQTAVEDQVRTDSQRFRNHINLNSTCEMSPEIELEVPSFAAKVASKIDLEASISSKVDNIIPLEDPMPLIKRDGSIKTDGSQGMDSSDETLVREAAENITRMSSDKSSITCHPSPPAPCDTLKWFADVVSSNLNGGSESSDDGLDHFELMTLTLEETKSDEYRCWPREPVHENDEEKGAASLLQTRPRRGQARRRRQRRDFQKDILPGLASLSKLEVTEDLQTIGGLMKASGRSWQMGLTRRNAGRKRRSRLSTVEIELTPPSTQPIDAEFQVDKRSMIGWGRTTRRCRRQRCPPVNVAALLT